MTPVFEGVGIALESLRANKVRAALTILGVAIGVAVVMVIAAMITGINQGVENVFNQLGPRTFFVFRAFQSGIQVNDGTNDQPWRHNPQITPEEASRIAALPAIDLVVIDQKTQGPVTFGNQSISSVGIIGRSSGWVRVSGGDVYPGRSFTRLEDVASARVAVLSQKLTEQLFARLDPIGRMVKIEGVPYEVIGVWTPPPDIFGGGNQPMAIVPHGAFTKYTSGFRSWVDLLVSPDTSVTVEDAIDEVTAVLRSTRGLRPGADNNFAIVTQDKLLGSFNSVTRGFFLVMIALSSVGLMVGGIGVIAIMMISVTERTREIGVRKALGATRRAILWQFLVEAATLTLVGGLAGMALGGIGTLIVKLATPLPASVPVISIVAAVGMSIVTGVVFGLVPAARAARLDPVEALRYE